jgi:hypothetical protein
MRRSRRSNKVPFQPADDGLGKLPGRRRASKVGGAHLVLVQRLVDRLAQVMGKLVPINVIKHPEPIATE